ncbi:MAG: lipopolysaccharide biosynthesis protein, partial [Candidatus Rokuibacteriota bacterium]
MTGADDGDGAGQLWRRFSRHGLAYLIGEIGGRGLSYLILILLAPLMSLEDFGYVNLFLTLVGLLTVLAGLGLPDAVVRFYYLDEPLDRIIGSTVLLIVIGSLALGVVVFFVGRPINDFLHVPVFVAGLSLACAPVTAVRQAWLEVFRARQRVGSYALTRLAEPLLMMGVVVLLLVRLGNPGYRSVLLAYGGSTAAVALVGLVMLSRWPGLRLELCL